MGSAHTDGARAITIQEAYLRGQYNALSTLTTSPRMNRAQIEVIEGLAYEVKAKLEAMGVTFTERED